MGDLRQEENETGIWARIYGGDTEINTSTPSQVQYRGMQVGYDSKLDLADGKLFKGIAISHMQGDVVYNAGKAETKSTMFGVYGSYQGKKGHFRAAGRRTGGGTCGQRDRCAKPDQDGTAKGLSVQR